MPNQFRIRPDVWNLALKFQPGNRARIQARGRQKILPVWTNMFTHERYASCHSIKFNGKFDAVPECLIYTRMISERAHLTSSCSPNLWVIFLATFWWT